MIDVAWNIYNCMNELHKTMASRFADLQQLESEFKSIDRHKI